jgi:hypothetical protein
MEYYRSYKRVATQDEMSLGSLRSALLLLPCSVVQHAHLPVGEGKRTLRTGHLLGIETYLCFLTTSLNRGLYSLSTITRLDFPYH